MSGTAKSAFSEPGDYQAALRRDGVLELVVSGRGAFHAELTRIELPRASIVAGAENLGRIAYISPRSDLVRIVLPARSGASSICNGVATGSHEIVAHGPDRNMHERTEAACQWRTIWLPLRELHRYGLAMLGRSFEICPGVGRWRPARAALNRLSRLHDDAMAMSKLQPHVTDDPEAAHGLEQELIEALVRCLSGKAIGGKTAAEARHTSIMDRFEDLLRRYPDHPPSISAICAAIEVPVRSLRACCDLYLGMGPHRYLHLRRLQHARRTLCSGGPDATNISVVARRYGFSGEGRFAG